MPNTLFIKKIKVHIFINIDKCIDKVFSVQQKYYFLFYILLSIMLQILYKFEYIFQPFVFTLEFDGVVLKLLSIHHPYIMSYF